MDQRARHSQRADTSFPLFLLHFGFALTGIGTTLLGPILPVLSAHWMLKDSQAGALIFVQFIGSSLGAVFVSRYLGRSLVTGYLCSAIGLGLLAYSSYHAAFPFFFLFGFGLGLSMTATNLIVSRQYADQRGSALSLVNFSWGAGAMFSPLIAGWMLQHSSMRGLMLGVGSVFLAVWMLVFYRMSRQPLSDSSQSNQQDAVENTSLSSGEPFPILLFFAVILFLYVGVENSVNGWLTTYALRFAGLSFLTSTATTSFFWISITSGRAIAAFLLKSMSEKMMQRTALFVAVFGMGGLLTVHAGPGVAFFAVLVGLALAPVFPIGLSLLLGRKALPRQVGWVLAVSGTGGAVLPWLTGILSTHFGSLQHALVLPLMAVFVMMGMSFIPAPETTDRKPHTVAR